MPEIPSPSSRYRKPKNEVIIPDRVAKRAALSYIENDNGCHISTYSVASHGYAQIGWKEPSGERHMTTAHRAAWVYANGRKIPEGATVDHACKVRTCVNPGHLRILSNFENARRTSGRDWSLGECANGHPNSCLHWNGTRYVCYICERERKARWQKNNQEKVRESNRKYREKKRLELKNSAQTTATRKETD